MNHNCPLHLCSSSRVQTSHAYPPLPKQWSAFSPLTIVWCCFCVLLCLWFALPLKNDLSYIVCHSGGGSYLISHDTFWTNSNDFQRQPALHFSLLIFSMNTYADESFMLSSSIKATEWELLSGECAGLMLIISQIPVWLCSLILVYSVCIDDARSQTQHIWDREMKIFNQQSYVSPKDSSSQIETQTYLLVSGLTSRYMSRKQ